MEACHSKVLKVKPPKEYRSFPEASSFQGCSHVSRVLPVQAEGEGSR